MARALPHLCYLCGQPLTGPVSVDHVPPKQLFALAIRKAHSLHLLTIPVHDTCNKAYQLDEDYFVHSLMPFARGTVAGQAIYDEVLAKFRAGKKVGLTRGVLDEFDPKPSGLVLPGGKVLKRQNGARIGRIALKIVRGLYFDHHRIVLPEKLNSSVSMTPLSQGEAPPDHSCASWNTAWWHMESILGYLAIDSRFFPKLERLVSTIGLYFSGIAS